MRTRLLSTSGTSSEDRGLATERTLLSTLLGSSTSAALPTTSSDRRMTSALAQHSTLLDMLHLIHLSVRVPLCIIFRELYLIEQEAFEKCWAHSLLRAASRPFTRCRQRYCRAPPARRCPRRQRQRRQRQRVTEGTAMAPWNGPKKLA